MKKILLAAASLAALTAGAAQAQTATTKAPFTVTLGGEARYTFGSRWDNQRNDGRSENGFDYRVTLEAKARHDAGFEYGAVVRFRNNQEGLSSTGAANDTVGADRKYIFIEGKYGRVQLGDMAGAMTAVEVKSPDAGFIQSDSYYTGISRLADVGAYDFFFMDEDTNGTKLTYLSPDIAGTGLKLGVSYSPDATESGRNMTRGTVAGLNNVYADVWEIAAGYSRTFGGVEVNLGAGYAWGSRANSAAVDPYKVFSIGGTVAYAGFTLGASYFDNNKTYWVRGSNGGIQHFDIGLTYAINDAITVGTTYGHTYYDRAIQRGTRMVDADDYLWTVGATYTVAPGLALQGDVGFFKAETANNFSGVKNDGTIAAMRARVQF